MEICQYITNIFFCDGASIWLRDEVVTNLYQLKGFHNFKMISPPNQKEYKCNANEGVLGDAVKTKKIQIITDIEKSNNLTFKDNLIEQNFQSMMVAPIIVPNDDLPIGTVSIYDYTRTPKESLDISIPQLNVISKFLGLAILVVKGLRQGEKDLRELTAHELGQAIASIYNTEERISYILFDEKRMPNIVTEHKHLKLLFNDIENYISDAQKTLSTLVSDSAISATQKGQVSSDTFVDSLLVGDQQWIDVKNLINNILHGEIKEIRRKNILFKNQVEDFPFFFYEKAVRRVLSNIINNAIKYTLPDMPKMFVTMEEDDYIKLIIVTNLGIKIQESDWENIFLRGYRTDEAKSIGDQETSRGLGLFVARKIARMWRGRVYVRESTPMDGFTNIYKTSFAIVFPKDNEVMSKVT